MNAYRYGFNGKEKSDEIKGEGNSYTAEFWEYDPRIGRRWNLDPKPIFGISEYSAFLNNPMLIGDAIGDTPRIYGNAEATRGTLSDKGGTADQAQKAINYRDAKLVPAINPKTNQLVGYNVFDTKNTDRNMPVMQIEPGDMEAFKNNYNNLMGGARMYYSNGEPSEGMKRIAVGIETGNMRLVGSGLKKEWRDALHDPVYVATLIVAFGHAGTAIADRSTLILPNRQQNGLTKFSYDGMSNVSGGRSGGKAPLLGNPNSYTITQGGHIIFMPALVFCFAVCACVGVAAVPLHGVITCN